MADLQGLERTSPRKCQVGTEGFSNPADPPPSGWLPSHCQSHQAFRWAKDAPLLGVLAPVTREPPYCRGDTS